MSEITETVSVDEATGNTITTFRGIRALFSLEFWRFLAEWQDG